MSYYNKHIKYRWQGSAPKKGNYFITPSGIKIIRSNTGKRRLLHKPPLIIRIKNLITFWGGCHPLTSWQAKLAYKITKMTIITNNG